MNVSLLFTATYSGFLFLYIIGVVVRIFKRESWIKGRRRAVLSGTNLVCCVFYVTIICLCIRSAILIKDQNFAQLWASLLSLLATGVASLACSLVLLLQGATLSDALFSLFGGLTWTLVYFRDPAPSSIQLAIPFSFLCCLLATLGIPYLVPGAALEHPLTKTPSIPSLTLSWLDPLLKSATKCEISTDNLWPVDAKLSEPHSLPESHARLARWQFLLPKGLIRVLLLEYTSSMLASGLLALVDIVVTFLQPFLLGALLAKRSSIFACGLFVGGIVGGTARAHSRFMMRKVGLRLRSALTALICDRNMSTAQLARADGGAPDPMTLMEVDLPQIFALVEKVHLIYLGPLQCLVNFCALAYILTWQSVLMGCTTIVIALPLFSSLMSCVFRRISRVMAAKDARISMVNEMLSQIRQTKLHGWQPYFRTRVDNARAVELRGVGRVALVNGAFVALASIVPTGLVAVTLGSYALMGGQLTSEIMFPALAFFFNINSGLTAISQLAMMYQPGVISLQRIRDHLSNGGLQAHHEDLRAHHDPPEILVEHASLGHPKGGQGRDVLLRDCNFEAKPDSLTVISGPLGSGKSTLLRSLIRSVQPVEGSITVHGTIAHAPQVPILIKGTLRENILFGLPFDGPFYERVINATTLGIDLATLPLGDQTVLGGTGAALSGGQKSRVALARAVYARRDIVILDNPLAALDGKVRKEIVNRVIGPEGLLRHTIRIVSGSQEPLVDAADNVFTIVGDRLERSNPSGVSTVSEPESEGSSSTELRSRILVEPIPSLSTSIVGCGTFGDKTVAPVVQTAEVSVDTGEEQPLLSHSTAQTGTPRRSGVDAVPLRTYAAYLKLANKGGWYIVIFLAVATKVVDVSALFFLKMASEGASSFGSLIYFTAFSSASSFVTFAFIIVAYFLCLIPASRRLHDGLTNGLLWSRFVFFDDNAPGQILSRFTNDMDKVDSQLNAGLIKMVSAMVMAMVPVVVILAAAPASLIYLVPIGLLYKYVQTLYLDAYRQLRRLENDAREDIINAAEELRTGESVIRCFDQTVFFQQRARKAIDSHIAAWGPFLALTIWLDLRLQLLASLVTLFSATLILSLNSPSSTLGLVMNFVLQITAVFNALVEVRGDLEADITSYERIQEYIDNPSEEYQETQVLLPANWPSLGSVEFNSYTAAYRPDGRPCLRSLNLVIPGGQHVAVTGRTGAGKSSIILALLRAFDKSCTKGSIRVDGLDISDLSLEAFRSRIALIPQEPAVVTGTLRENLDPLGKLDDFDMLQALTSCQAIEVLGLSVNEHPLEHRISRSSLSAGQVQVLALARAVASRCKIIILDEATAAIDVSTAAIVQEAIKSRFRDSTMISITHNAETSKMDDRILVIDHGNVAKDQLAR